MLGIGFIELLKGIGKMFINPLLYWIVFLLFMMGWRRIKKERRQFGTKIYPFFTELKGTLGITIIFSILLSIASILLGFVMSFEMVALLLLVIIIVSITGRTTLLSASYTFGITFILLLLLPYINVGPLAPYIDVEGITKIHFLSLVFFMAICLFAETILISMKKGASFPELKLGSRGLWIGQHRLKRLAFIPFIALLPVQDPALALPIFPYIDYGDTGYSLILIPFVIGSNYTVRGALPIDVAQKLGRANWFLSVTVLLIAIVSIYYPYASILAVFVAIIGKEWMMYRHKKVDKYKQAFFAPLDQGVKVLATLPDSPADRLGIDVGETITKVNGQSIQTATQFYEALQNSGAFFKLDILDHQGEIRFIHRAFYDEDHHELGIIFIEHPSKK